MTYALSKLVAFQLNPSLTKVLFVVQWAILLVWIPITLYGLFFAPIGVLHNAVHPARHGVTVIPCH